MKKKLLALGLAALLTATQFNVVKAATKDDTATKSGQAQVATKVNEVVEKEIPLRQHVKGEITKADEAVKYKVQIPEVGSLSLDLDIDMDTALMGIIDDKGNEIISAEVTSKESTVDWKSLSYVQPGTYYITISSSYIGSFKIYVSYAKLDTNEIEPNNSMDKAQKIGVDKETIEGLFPVNDNVDIYKLDVEKDSALSFGLKSKCSFLVEILDDKGNMLHVGILGLQERANAYEGFIVEKFKAGSYYVIVTKPESMSKEFLTYELNVKSITKDGWNELGDNDYVYYDSINNSFKKGWLLYYGTWYYLDENGVMVKDLQIIDKKAYYFAEGGAMQTGWVKYYNNWFYFSESGAAKSGWLLYYDTWYYLENNGLMSTGFRRIDKKLYYFAKSGEMKTGWIKEAGKWYYFEENGAGKSEEWLRWDNNWYYFNKAGVMVTGSLKINGVVYNFNQDGTLK
ncbi:glucan-binding YG repeat protein [Clostridium punense]|uniref:Glucan-binding YG repeat protein n=1 Tax=Clostridium punense TaxID=1054297 RepID=A0ABS4K3A7_9CLOT|nr:MULTISPECIES: N-acetylmuramoyl-L-alanine amidase family protein [Clostridium]EQB88419.1 hypothetical protein M918_04555 [Clostridium sp. BL8]MBP2021139.1 glucan-binding YG repeat protein [Clostridium punense]